MWRLLTVLVCVMTLSAVEISVFSADIPTGFKGFVLGSSLAKAQTDNKFHCRNSDSLIADTTCILKPEERETIAGANVQSLSLLYYGDKLESIYISFAEKDFDSVATALTAKYGPPESRISTVRNRYGAEFENRYLTWKVAGYAMRAQRYAGNIEKSTVTFATDSSIEEYQRRRSKSVKDKKGDL